MTELLGKFAPCAIVLAAVTYCCWPYLEDAGQRNRAGEEKKLPEIAATVLAPKIEPAPGRDPFGMTGGYDMFKVVDSKANRKDPNQPAAPGAKGGTEKSNPAPDVVKKAVEQDLKAAKNNLTLNATFVRGDRHVAMINGERFTEGDTLERANTNVKMVKVSKILPKKVVLEKQGQTIDLGYPDIYAPGGTAQIKSGSAAPARTTTPGRPAARPATHSNGARPGTAAPKTKPRSAARSLMTR